ncbi:IS3 family transposase [Clostridium sp. CM027]|uniref:IS3 family transposase n=1 Tax=Clostridium sp. CM027 TaxID=2849865 RepID=UPI00215A8C2F|nr:IS3 family transposase [Clostridium sp. CM027]
MLKTLNRLECNLNLEDNSDTIIHPDQGFHYTNADFQSRVKELGLTQSKSRKGNCLDNAPMESFFGHMKDEMEYKQAMSFGELVGIVDSYMSYYNNDRYQWGLNKMSPAQYRTHFLVLT